MGPEFEPSVGTVSTYPRNMPAEHAGLRVLNAGNRFHEGRQPGHRTWSLRQTTTEGKLVLSCKHLPPVKSKNAGDFVGKTEKTS